MPSQPRLNKDSKSQTPRLGRTEADLALKAQPSKLIMNIDWDPPMKVWERKCPRRSSQFEIWCTWPDILTFEQNDWPWLARQSSYSLVMPKPVEGGTHAVYISARKCNRFCLSRTRHAAQTHANPARVQFLVVGLQNTGYRVGWLD